MQDICNFIDNIYYMSLTQNYHSILTKIPKGVTLVAVSKTKPMADIEVLYQEGQRVFGENRVQELVEKHEALPKDIEWHMIGHLQSKKTKYIAPFISLIHSVDSIKLLKEINKQAKNNDRVINCLLQFHIAQEKAKYGFELDEVIPFIEEELNELKNVNITGVMGMATFTDNQETVKSEFKSLKAIFDELKKNYLPNIETISMGMSGDFELAINEGSTMVRVGSSIFGGRG
jgi:pyridoxal phosphate enzyme (YggS family)